MKCEKCNSDMIASDEIYLSSPPKIKLICPNCNNSKFLKIDNQNSSEIDCDPTKSKCFHDFRLEFINGEYISVCRKCGKIGDRRAIL